jgi:rhodanese-related sulfurtransferase
LAIDPPAVLAGRIALLARARGSVVRAVLTTGEDAQGRAGCDALCEALAGQGVPFEAGWPRQAGSVRLGDGRAVPALRVGREWLARIAQADRACYLLGPAHDDTLEPAAVRLAFSGAAAGCGVGLPLAALVNPDTILCHASEADDLPWSTPAALARGSGPAAGTVSAMHLDAEAIERFFDAHPDAMLVDVREAPEHAAGAAQLWGRTACSVPMSRLAEHAAQWLRGERRPLVFFCRSGNRSARAAHALRLAGYDQAWHIPGGLALAAS